MGSSIMEITRYVVAGTVVALVGSYAAGRYSVDSPAIHTVVDTRTDTKTRENEDTHTQTKIIEVKTPDGTDTKTTTIDQVKDEEIAKVQDQVEHVDQTVTPPKKGTLNISALVGTGFMAGNYQPLYGASITKEIVGPVTIGAWGLNNGTIGVSIGLTF